MNREVHVRLREGLSGKLPRSTRLYQGATIFLNSLDKFRISMRLLLDHVHLLWIQRPIRSHFHNVKNADCSWSI
jgi:hypothetical protein